MDPRPPDDQTPQDPDPWARPPSGEPPAPPSAMTPPPPAGDAFVGVEASEDGPPRRRGRTVVAMVVAAGLVLGGGAAATAFLLMRGSTDRIVNMIPATTDVVMTAYLDPAASQKANLLTLARKFPALAEKGGGLGDGVNDMIDQALRDSGLTHRDVLPWLGSQVSSIVALDPDTFNPSFALLIETDDEEAAYRTIPKLSQDASIETHSYKGVETHVGDEDSWAIVDGVAVLTDDSTFLTTIIDTSQGDTKSIADDPRYVSTLAALPEGKLGFVYVNPARFLDEFASMAQGLGMEGSSTPGFQQLEAYRAIGMSLSAERDGLAIDVTVRLDPSKLDAATKAQLDAPAHDNAVLPLVPADSYAVFSQEHLDLSLQQALDQILATAPEGQGIPDRFGVDETLASLTGDVAFEVSPGTDGPIGAAVLLGVDERGPAQKTLDELAAAIVPLLQSNFVGTTPELTTSELTKREIKQLEKFGIDPSEFEFDRPTVRWRSTTYQGTTIKYLEDSDLAGSGLAPAYAVLDGAAVIATDPGEIRQLIDVQNGEAAITGVPRYVDAIGRVPTGGGAAFIDVEAVVSAIRQSLPPEIQAAFDEDAGPNLAPVKVLVTGTENSSQGSTTRIFVVIE